jgi:hypothetical protein
MFEKGGSLAIPALTDWKEALDRPGAKSMRYVRKIFESRPFHLLVPKQQAILNNSTTDSLVIRAAAASDGSFMLVYAGVGQELHVDLKEMKNGAVAWWYNPRNGKASKVGKIKSSGSQKFVPPASGRETTGFWCLMILKENVNH